MQAVEIHTSFILISAFLLYAAASLMYCLRVIFNRKDFVIMGLRVTLLAVLFHLISFTVHLAQTGYPYFRSSFEGYQLVSLGILVLFLILSFLYRFLATGLILVPMGILFFILSLTHYTDYPIPTAFQNNQWAAIHFFLIFIAMALFLISFITGMLYLLEEYRLKHKQWGSFIERFPPLEIMDFIHYRSLYLGFAFFSLGMITGGGWNKSVTGSYISEDPKQWLSFVIWGFFALFLGFRNKFGWIGRKGILLASLGIVELIGLFIWVQGH